jgi:hypothetical protein
VAAWKMLITNPIASATSNNGAETRRVISMAFWPMVITLSGVIAFLLCPKNIVANAEMDFIVCCRTRR